MSTEIQQAKKAAGAKAAAVKDAQKNTKQASEQDRFWRKIKEEDVGVALRGEGSGEKKPEIIRRTKTSDGKYVPIKKDSGQTLITVDGAMKVGGGSYGAGDGNCGRGKDFEIHRGNANFVLMCRIGTLSDGKGGPTLVQEQTANMEWNERIARKVMRDLFHTARDNDLATWKLPVDRALTEARKEMFQSYKDDNGVQLARYTDLIELEETKPDVHKAVDARAAEIFVDNAKALPGSVATDSNGAKKERMLRKTKKVWKFAKFDPKRDKMSTEKGPLLTDLPSDIEHWAAVHEAMTDPKGKMRRAYNPLTFADAKTGQPLQRPKVSLMKEKINPTTGQREKTVEAIEDPFWDPALQFAPGRPCESLIATPVVWSFFRGPLTTSDNYGIHLKIAGPISIGGRAPRADTTVILDDEWVTGFDEDPEAAEDLAALHAVPEPKATTAPGAESATHGADHDVATAEQMALAAASTADTNPDGEGDDHAHASTSNKRRRGDDAKEAGEVDTRHDAGKRARVAVKKNTKTRRIADEDVDDGATADE